MEQHFAYRLDGHRLQCAFDRKAADFDDHAWLYREVGNRLLEHLEPIRIEPHRVLDLGSGTGEIALALTRRFKSAQIYSLDYSRQMLLRARSKSPRWFRRQAFICADAGSLGITDRCLQMICGNLILPWISDAPQVLREAYRVLDSGGLLMLSSLGPQSLIELREAFRQVDSAAHINDFMDMHELGDVMAGAGFRDIVVDVERLSVSYKTFRALLTEVRAMGAGNANTGRRRGLMTQDALARVERFFEANSKGGQCQLSFELVFAHGWKLEPPTEPIEVEWRGRF